MSLAELKEAIEQLPRQDRRKPLDSLSLELSDAESDKLNAWADHERASGRTRVFESARAYVAHRKSHRAQRNAALRGGCAPGVLPPRRAAFRFRRAHLIAPPDLDPV